MTYFIFKKRRAVVDRLVAPYAFHFGENLGESHLALLLTCYPPTSHLIDYQRLLEPHHTIAHPIP